MEHELQEAEIIAQNSDDDTESYLISRHFQTVCSNRVQSWVENTQHELLKIVHDILVSEENRDCDKYFQQVSQSRTPYALKREMNHDNGAYFEKCN